MQTCGLCRSKETFLITFCVPKLSNTFPKVMQRFEEIVKSEGIIQTTTPNTNFFNESLRRAFSIRWVDKQQGSNILQRHRGFWTKRKLERMRFNVKGCLSYWGRKLFPKFISDFYDIIFWDFPTFTGTLVAIKIVKKAKESIHTVNERSNE